MNVSFQFEDRTAILAAQFRKKIDAGLLTAGKEVIALASVLAPVDTGALARSGAARLTAPGEVTVSFGTENDSSIQDIRAIAQEYGTVYHGAQPYLTPAIRTVNIGYFLKRALQRFK